MIVCKKCGKEFEKNAGRGRPRAFCKECRLPREKAPAPVVVPVVAPVSAS